MRDYFSLSLKGEGENQKIRLAMTKATFRLLGFLLLILLFLLPVVILKLFDRQGIILPLFYRIVSALWGVRVIQTGEFSRERPLLLVSNHCSYLDIPVLGQLIDLRFTPKTEIAGWPLIGQLCHLAGCVFIDRRRGKTQENRTHLLRQLERGLVLSLFPEGTTNDGSGIQPFRSSFFSLAEIYPGLQVQPVVVQYSHPDGRPLDRAAMDRVAWYAEMEFVPHLWDYLQTPGVLATVTCLPPVTLAAFPDRKALAKHCEEAIAKHYAHGILSGNLLPEQV